MKYSLLILLLSAISVTGFSQNKLNSLDFITFNHYSTTVSKKLASNQPLTVAFLGGSITYNPGWRNLTINYLKQTYPNVNFRFINAGIPSLGSFPHSFRLQTDVLDSGKIDWLFVEAAVNDHANNTPETQQRRAIEGIIRHSLKANPKTNLVLMAFADESKNEDYDKGNIPTEVKVHSDLATHYHLPFINLALEVDKRIANREFSWKEDFKDLHPSPFGQQLYFNTIKAYIDENQKHITQKDNHLPEAIDPLAYGKGHYVNINTAQNLNTFNINPNWKPKDALETRKGFVNIPVLESATKNSSFDFNFSGTAVGITIISGPDAGVLQYRIDNGEEKTIDLFTPWSASLHLPWYLLLADGLSRKNHNISIRISEYKNPKSKGNACRIAYFLVNGN
jgi:hypothetical protein